MIQRPLRSALPSGQGGVALAIVVWFIAGMSLLVAGIVAQARVDTRMTQNHLARAVAVAAGDGAIRLMMAELLAANDPLVRARGEAPDGRYRLGEVAVTVVVVPTSGLIDINAAPVEVLSALFRAGGVLGEEDSRVLAQNVVQSRSVRKAPRQGNRGVELNAMEDLLRVPGFSRALLDSVRDFIVVGEAGQGAIKWVNAPEELLAVLAETDPARADAVRARKANAPDAPGRMGQTDGAYRADAIVQYGDKTWLRRRWILMSSDSSSSLPWRVVRTEPPRVAVGVDKR